MKIKVVIPYYLDWNRFDYPVKKSVYEMLHDKRYEYCICPAQGYDPGEGRNKGVSLSQLKKQTAKEYGDYGYFLFVDPDTRITPNQVQALINRKKHIISAAYDIRNMPGFINAGKWDDQLAGNKGEHYKNDKKGLHEADFVGGGALLVDSSVFSELGYPWFRREIISKDGHSSELSEDYGFCLHAQRAGFKMYVDCDVKAEHILTEPKCLQTQKTEPKCLQAQKNENYIPSSIADDIVAITENINKLAGKYKRCYEALKKMGAR